MSIENSIPDKDLFIASREGKITRAPETSWVDKFKAAKKVTWLPEIYAESDLAQDFNDSVDFQIDEEEQRKIVLGYSEAWAKDLLDSNSQEELDFKKERAQRAKEAYAQLGNLGFGSVSALFAAGLTDPALLPLWFNPYARIAGAGKALKGGARYWSYAKKGMIVGGAEATAISAAEYMLRPDAQLKDVLFGASLGVGIGGALAGVTARLRRDIDADHFDQTGTQLTNKGKEKYEGHTPAEKQARVIDAATDETEIEPIKVPKFWDDATDIKTLSTQLDNVLRQGLRGGAFQIKQLRKEITRRENARTVYQVGDKQITQQKFANRLYGVTDGKTVRYFKRTKDGTFRSNKNGDLLERLGSERFARGNAVRKLLNYKSSTRVDEVKEDLSKLSETEKRLRENDKIAAGTLKPEDVPRLADNIFNKIRIRHKLSAISRTMQSQSAKVRAIASRLGLVSGALINASGKMVKTPVNALSRSALIQSYMNTTVGKIIVRAERASNLRSKQVREEIGLALNNPRHNTPTELQPFVDELRKLLDDVHKMAVKAGVFEPDAKLENYFPRIFRPDYIDSIVEKMGGKRKANKQMVKAINELIVDLLPERLKPLSTANAAKYNKIAAAYWSVLSSVQPRSRLTRTGQFADSAFDSEEDTLRKILRENLDADVTDADLDRVLYALSPDKKAKAKNVHARSRMELNDTKVIKLTDKNGNEFDFKFTDLVEKDAYTVMNIYSHRMGGSIALAEQGIDSVDGMSFSRLLDSLSDDADVTPSEIESLTFMYQTLRGTASMGETMDLSTSVFLRRLRDFNFIRMMGMSGLAAMVETTNVMFENGFRHFLTNVPAIPSMIRRVKASGQLQNELVREVEIGNGLGADVFTGKAIARFEDTSDDISRATQTHGKPDELLAHGRRMVSLLGGLTPVTVFLQRIHQYNTVTKFYKELVKKGNLKVYNEAKLKQLNLDEAMLKRIQEQMKKHSTLDGKKLKTLNSKDWTDPEAVDAFEYALYLDTTQTIQIANPSSINRFFRSEVGKTAFQFWTYPVAATEQQYARYASRIAEGGDLRPLAIISGAMGVSMLTYMSRAIIKAREKEDPQEYLEKKFEPLALARGSLSQVGALGVGSFIFGYDGLNPQSLINNPTIQLGSGIYTNAVDGDVAGLIKTLNPNNPLLGAPLGALAGGIESIGND